MDWSDLKWIADVGAAMSHVGMSKTGYGAINGEVGKDVEFGVNEGGPYVRMKNFRVTEEMTTEETRVLAGYLIRAAKEADMMQRAIEIGIMDGPKKKEN